MFNKKRRWHIGDVPDVADLAAKVSDGTWTSCTAFRLGGYLFVNDQLSEDGAGEWGVLKAGDVATQVESITLGWCTAQEAQRYIEQCLAGEFDGTAFPSGVTQEQFDDGPGHRCRLCA